MGALSGVIGGAILTGTLNGAFYGGLTGAALGAIGASGWKDISKSIASGTASGITADLQGGKFGHGFLSAGVGFWTGLKFGGPPNFGKFLGTAIAGGTISAVTGGKFANGAFSAALSYTIASSMRRGVDDQGRPLTENEIAAAKEAYGDQIKDYEGVRFFGRKWIPFQGMDVAMAPDGNIYWPAARGCVDLTACTLTTSDGYQYQTLPTFIHEMGHVMQHQLGFNVVLRALPHQLLNMVTFGKYNPYMSIQQFYETPTPLGLNVEAQANWYMHSFCTRTGRC